MKVTPQRKAMNVIWAACAVNDISQNELAKRAGVCPATVSSDKHDPSKCTLDRMLRYMTVLGIKEITIER